MPDKDTPCEELWYSKPAVLFRLHFLTDDICEANNINSVIRGLILFLSLGLILSVIVGPAGLLIALISLLILYHKWLLAKVYPDKGISVKEPFVVGTHTNTEPIVEESEFVTRPGVAVPLLTKPTAQNPFMNVMLDELTYNPTRPPADDIGSSKNQNILDDYFRVQWFSDPTDVFGKTQGQRQFYTMPSSSIPNDQSSYANWLYLIPGKTCKEGGSDACVPGTNGGAIPWLSQPN